MGIEIAEGTINLDGTVVGFVIIFTGLITAMLNLLIASKLRENKVRAVIHGLGWGCFLSLLAPFFLLYRTLFAIRKLSLLPTE